VEPRPDSREGAVHAIEEQALVVAHVTTVESTSSATMPAGRWRANRGGPAVRPGRLAAGKPGMRAGGDGREAAARFAATDRLLAGVGCPRRLLAVEMSIMDG
jgi:hypothetical protein